MALTLVSEVARAYIELRDLDRRLEIARRTLESRREYVGLARDRFEGGVTSEIDWRQAEAEFFRVQSFVYEMEKLVAQKENELSVLLGRNPAAIARGRSLEEQPMPPAVPVGPAGASCSSVVPTCAKRSSSWRRRRRGSGKRRRCAIPGSA